MFAYMTSSTDKSESRFGSIHLQSQLLKKLRYKDSEIETIIGNIMGSHLKHR